VNSLKFPLHSAGEGKGSLKKLSFILSLPLRERIKVRGAVKFFSSSFFPLHKQERARVRGKLKFFQFSLLSPCGREPK
jgi:hypothetical protein